MWFAYTIVHVFLLAIVNYLDEYLTNNNKVPKNSNIHKKVGGLILISTLMGFVGAAAIQILSGDIGLSLEARNLALVSSIPIVVMYASYFYLLLSYPVHQVAPLFQFSALWLLVFELLSGANITGFDLFGILVLVYGAYLLDAGTFRWKIPTKLIFIAIPTTSAWAIVLFLVRTATQTGASSTAITYWQLIGIGVIGVMMFLLVKKYREGFLFRIKKQGKSFLGLSLANESISQTSYLFSNLAVALAPLATFVPSLSGVQSLFVLILFFLFPLGERTKATKVQWIAITLIAVGVFLIGR
jgi:drug/metabolite transporter (DMT)-like permease